MSEIWKDVTGYEGLYQVSNTGHVKSLKRTIIRNNGRTLAVKEKILGVFPDGRGYSIVFLSKNGETKHFFMHRLVAEKFIPNTENKPQVNHIDGNKTNNCVENLEWVTGSENMYHSYKIGLHKRLSPPKGKDSPYAKAIIQLDRDGKEINRFSSIKDAERETKISNGSISSSARGYQKTAGGYMWRYADE